MSPPNPWAPPRSAKKVSKAGGDPGSAASNGALDHEAIAVVVGIAGDVELALDAHRQGPPGGRRQGRLWLGVAEPTVEAADEGPVSELVAGLGPRQVQAAVPGPAGRVDGEPRLVAAVGLDRPEPALAAVLRNEHVAENRAPRHQAVVVEASLGVGGEDRVGAEDPVVERAPLGPAAPAVGAPAPARLAEVRGDAVELPPADRHPQRCVGVDRDRGLVGRVANDVAPVGRDVDLDADEAVALDPHRLAELRGGLGLGNRRLVEPLCGGWRHAAPFVGRGARRTVGGQRGRSQHHGGGEQQLRSPDHRPPSSSLHP